MKNSGFTLIEMMLGVVISAIIFLTIGSVVAVFYSSDAKTQRTQIFEQTKNDLAVEISNAVKWSDLIAISANSITADTTTYTLNNGRILKNGSALTSSDVIINSFDIENKSVLSSLKSLEINISMSSKRFSLLSDQFKLVVSQRNKSITTE